MRKNLLRGLAVTGAAAAVALTMTSTAVAAPPSSVEINGTTVAGSGPATDGGYPIVGVSTAAINFTAGVAMSCSTVEVYGEAYAGSPAPSPIANLTSSNWGGCVGPLGIGMEVAQSGTWALTGSNVSSGVTTGTISNVHAHVQDSSTHGGICSFDVAGTVGGSFTNSSQILAVTGPSTLTVSNVSGCFSLVPNGTTASFTGNFDVQKVPTGPVRPTPGPHWPIIIS
jgi:hypothetical protein